MITDNDDLDSLLGGDDSSTPVAEVTETPALVPGTSVPMPTEDSALPEEVEDDEETPATPTAEEEDTDDTVSVRFGLRVKFDKTLDDKFKKALRADAGRKNKELLAAKVAKNGGVSEGVTLSAEEKIGSKDILNALFGIDSEAVANRVLDYVNAAQTREFTVRVSQAKETIKALDNAKNTINTLRNILIASGKSPAEIDELLAQAGV